MSKHEQSLVQDLIQNLIKDEVLSDHFVDGRVSSYAVVTTLFNQLADKGVPITLWGFSICDGPMENGIPDWTAKNHSRFLSTAWIKVGELFYSMDGERDDGFFALTQQEVHKSIRKNHGLKDTIPWTEHVKQITHRMSNDRTAHEAIERLISEPWAAYEKNRLHDALKESSISSSKPRI